MQRRVVVGGVLAVLVVVLALVWPCGGRTSTPSTTGSATSPTARATTRTPAPASLAGTVRDRGGAAIAAARVCVEAWPRVACAATDAAGAYRIAGLAPASYEITATARTFRLAALRPRLWIAAGETRTGVDVVLDGGGVELTGIVLDISGGPIDHALVRAGTDEHNINRLGGWGAGVETNAAGEFSLWLPPGERRVLATADGYAAAEADAPVPGRVTIRLTPAGGLSGTVVDTAGQPVADADVAADAVNVHEHVRTNAAGEFRITGLRPERYDVIARSPNGYGRSAGSIAVGLGANVEGLVLTLYPAARVSGRVMIAGGRGCPEAEVQLRDAEHDREVFLVTDRDGNAVGDGLLPGTYAVFARCTGYASEATYPPVVIGDRDVTGLEWRVTAGATVRGRVLRAGQGVGDARVRAGRERVTSAVDGTYALVGLPVGDTIIEARTPLNERAQIERVLPAGSTELDITVDQAGLVRGEVVDQRGAPVPDLGVSGAVNKGEPARSRTDEHGHFEMPVRPGVYMVGVGDLMHPTSEQTVTVAAGQTVTLRFVVPRAEGWIRGRVLDEAGAPIDDAFVEVKRPSMLDWALPAEATALTDSDGAFAFEHLDAGRYTVNARRKGGGEIRERGVETGTTLSLQIAATGSIAGTVDGDSVILKLRDKAQGFYREEEFYRTRGAFTVRDLPAGTYTVAAETPDGFGVATVAVTAGKVTDGVRIEIDKLVAMTGRVIEAGPRTPLAGFQVIARSARAQLGTRVDAGNTAIASRADGRFTTRTPRGPVTIEAHAPGVGHIRRWCSPSLVRDVQGPIELGDLAVVRIRLAEGETAGVLGFTLVESFDEPANLEIATSTHTELRAGDVITAIDGIAVAEVGRCASTLLAVPAKRSLALTLARGDTVTIVTR